MWRRVVLEPQSLSVLYNRGLLAMQFFISSSIQQLCSAKCIKLTGNKDWNSILAPFKVRTKRIQCLFYLFIFPILAMSFVLLATKLARLIFYPELIYKRKKNRD